jgi:hypothetical protein
LSSRRSFKISVLRKIGFNLHRCHLCRRRFYLFKPLRLRGFLLALDSEASGTVQANAPGQVLDAAEARWWTRQDSNV